jgi:hypothetical protein
VEGDGERELEAGERLGGHGRSECRATRSKAK